MSYKVIGIINAYQVRVDCGKLDGVKMGDRFIINDRVTTEVISLEDKYCTLSPDSFVRAKANNGIFGSTEAWQGPERNHFSPGIIKGSIVKRL